MQAGSLLYISTIVEYFPTRFVSPSTRGPKESEGLPDGTTNFTADDHCLWQLQDQLSGTSHPYLEDMYESVSVLAERWLPLLS